MHRHDSGAIAVVREAPESHPRQRSPSCGLRKPITPAHAAAAVETVVVTSSKIKGDIQTVPIAITALSQEQLTSRQIAGGPDLVKEVPNLTFSKTNFTGYNDPDSRHRHAGDFGDDRSGRGRGAERYSLHPQSFLRAGILRRQSGRSAARAARHALWPQRDGRRGERHLRQADRPVRGDAVRRLGQLSPTAATKAWSIFRSSTIGSICASRANGPSATATRPTKTPAPGRWPRSVVDAASRWAGKPVQSVQAYLVWEHFSEDDDRMRTQQAIVQNGQSGEPSGIVECAGRAVSMPPDTIGSGVDLAFR